MLPGHYVLSGDDVIYPLSKSVRCASLDDVIIQLCGGDRHGPHGSPESVASGWDNSESDGWPGYIMTSIFVFVRRLPSCQQSTQRNALSTTGPPHRDDLTKRADMFHQLLAPDAGRQSRREGSLDRRAERRRPRLSGTRKSLVRVSRIVKHPLIRCSKRSSRESSDPIESSIWEEILSARDS